MIDHFIRYQYDTNCYNICDRRTRYDCSAKKEWEQTLLYDKRCKRFVGFGADTRVRRTARLKRCTPI